MSELMKFIESNCPKFNKVCQITRTECCIKKDHRCLCFEEALPHPQHAYRPEGFDYDQIEAEYLPLAKTRTQFISRKHYDYWRHYGWGSLFSSKVEVPIKIDPKSRVLGMESVIPTARLCGCGETLSDAQRVCDKCKIERRRETKRRAMQKYRGAEPALKEAAKKRLCECGKTLKPRRRMCDKCRDHSRKWSNFHHQRKYRESKMSNVSN